VPTGPGSGVDSSARTVQQIFQSNKLVEQVINTTNKPGGNYGIAMNYLSQHNGDAHKLMLQTSTPLTAAMQGQIPFDIPRGFIGPRALSADQVRYWDSVFARMVKSDDWREAVEKNQCVENYMNSADYGKDLRRPHGILKDVLGELGMVQ
jgi:tripartite-type tricarboxylate transporter receptor subunit TctC